MPPSYTQAADDDLRAIYRDGVRLFGVAQAERYAAALGRTCQLIGEFPRSAPVRRGIVPAVRTRSVGSHVVLYEILDAEQVSILRVRHAREDWTADPVSG